MGILCPSSNNSASFCMQLYILCRFMCKSSKKPVICQKSKKLHSILAVYCSIWEQFSRFFEKNILYSERWPMGHLLERLSKRWPTGPPFGWAILRKNPVRFFLDWRYVRIYILHEWSLVTVGKMQYFFENWTNKYLLVTPFLCQINVYNLLNRLIYVCSTKVFF